MSARSIRALVLLFAAALVLALAVPVRAGQGGVERFATIPPGPGHPEGLAADSHGNIYAATFEFPPAPNKIHAFRPNGQHRFAIDVAFSPLGMLITPEPDGSLWVADFGNGRAVQFRPPFSAASTPFRTIAVCAGPASGTSTPCGLNAFALDASGDLYVSDSFGGRIFKIDLPSGTVSPFFSHDLLKPGSHGFPPFGANGLAFSASYDALFIANTADDRILRLAIAGGAPGALTTFAESVNGADGIVFDAQGRLWVAANQADELVALNSKGRVVARRGSFRGFDKDGAPKGLLFPASPVISRGAIYVTNLALALTPAVGDEPEEDVKVFTVSRVPLDGGGRDDWNDGED